MSPRWKKVVAVASVALGLFILFFEFYRADVEGRPVNWFWLAVAGLAVVLGVIELFSQQDQAG